MRPQEGIDSLVPCRRQLAKTIQQVMKLTIFLLLSQKYRSLGLLNIDILFEKIIKKCRLCIIIIPSLAYIVFQLKLIEQKGLQTNSDANQIGIYMPKLKYPCANDLFPLLCFRSKCTDPITCCLVLTWLLTNECCFY